MSALSVQEYYRRITDQDIGSVARDLLSGAITEITQKALLCNCPNHNSQSKRSLHIMLDKQGWYCFGCRLGGDILQLVEFVQSKCVSSKIRGHMPESHRRARDFLAHRVGMNRLGGSDASEDSVELAESNYALDMSARRVLTELAGIYHKRLKAAPEVLAWLKSSYAIDDQTIDDLLIGFSNNDDGTYRVLKQAPHEFTHEELLSSGAFIPKEHEGGFAFFNNRITFPYWSRGSVGFMIARKTPWTPVNKYESGKYKKLRVHDLEKASYIARGIDNSLLYNEDCLLNKPKRVVITEGVTDCIALMQRGIPTISPVTVRIKEDDWNRILPKLHGIDTVYICQDNELSQVGLQGALDTARQLAQHNIETKLVTLPLGVKQKTARETLKDQYRINIENTDAIDKCLKELPEDERKKADQLIADSKIDVNEFFAGGGTREQFEVFLSEACTPTEYGIRKLDGSKTGKELEKDLEPVLLEVSKCMPMEQDRLIKVIARQVGKAASVTTLREQLRVLTRHRKESEKEHQSVTAKQDFLRTLPGEDGTCRSCVQRVLIESAALTRKPDFARAAEAAFQWFIKNGAKVFKTMKGEPLIYFQHKVYWMDSPDFNARRTYQSMIWEHTNILICDLDGKRFLETLRNNALRQGKVCDRYTWRYSDTANLCVYFSLNNERHEIVKISPEGVEVIENGANADGVLLVGAGKIKPINYISDADESEGERLLFDLIGKHLSCSEHDRLLILSWLSCFMLIDFSSTLPITRFEGSAGSGKTTASKLISTFVYGEPLQKRATEAANYADGAQNPLVLLDNIESPQMTPGLIAFLLTSATGCTNQKRKMNTDSETVDEQIRCLVNTTGIEPLAGRLTEVQSRTFIINFDESLQEKDFIETDAIGAIKKNRDLIFSALFKRTSRILAMKRDGLQKDAMNRIQLAVPFHAQRRCNEYLSLMFLSLLASQKESLSEERTANYLSRFTKLIGKLNSTSIETSRESNQIAAALHVLFTAYELAKKTDESQFMAGNLRSDCLGDFNRRSQLTEFCDDSVLRNVKAASLYRAMLTVVKRDRGIEFDYVSAHQFARRFADDLEIIRGAGFEISTAQDYRGTKLYTISRK